VSCLPGAVLRLVWLDDCPWIWAPGCVWLREGGVTVFTRDAAHHAQSKSIWRKLLSLVWMCGVIATLSVLGVFVADRLTFFQSSPTSTTLELVRQRPIDFPAVTVCASTIAWNSRLNDLGDGAWNSFVAAPSESVMRLLGTHPMELILQCSFAGFKCTAQEAEEWLHPQYGMCLTFNGGQRPFRVGHSVYDAETLRSGETLQGYLQARATANAPANDPVANMSDLKLSSKGLQR
jgi:hypothetical protein